MTPYDYSAETLIHCENIIRFEAQSQGHKEVKNVCDTSSYGETLMYQTWYVYVKEQKSCGPNKALSWTL